MSRSFEGIGARLRLDDDYVTIDEVMAGGPAFRGKELKSGDKIVAVAQGENGDYEDIVGWRLDDAILLIRGQKGTMVRLKIIPAGSSLSTPPKEIRLMREKIKTEEETIKKKVVTQTHNGKTYKVGVIEVPSFYIDYKAYQAGELDYKSTSRDTKKAIQELKQEGVQGIIMDLRNNGGGSLKEAIDLTGLFIKTGPVVQVRDIRGQVETETDEDDEVAYDGPLAVMVNGFSASASEIFSAAIQDYKRGIIVGEQTYGKGTVQTPVDLSRFVKGEKGDQHGHINLTVSKYYRINGSSTQNLGVKPDIALPDALDRAEFGEASERATLPSDEIRTAKYTPAGQITDKKVETLRKSFEKRLKTDAELKELVQSIEDLRKLRQNSKISLNETKRKQEIDEYEKKQKQKANLEDDDESPAEAKPTEEKKEKKDLYLQNAAQVLAELIGIQAK
jgi:carboxyl-terminal processing protease